MSNKKKKDYLDNQAVVNILSIGSKDTKVYIGSINEKNLIRSMVVESEGKKITGIVLKNKE